MSDKEFLSLILDLLRENTRDTKQVVADVATIKGRLKLQEYKLTLWGSLGGSLTFALALVIHHFYKG